jgi:microcin C transport system substrate-binding protein
MGFRADHKTLYFRINPKARWSDGQPVTADDWLFTLKMMRSKEINDPWYNNYYSTQISEVTKFDDHTSPSPAAAPRRAGGFAGIPAVQPGAQPRHQAHRQLGQGVQLESAAGHRRLPDWRAEEGQVGHLRPGQGLVGTDERYFQHRFNPDRIEIKVLRIRTSPGSTSCAAISTPFRW